MNRTLLLFINVLVIATCGLVYELVAGTLASYVLGDSVTQFSLCIGIYLSAMGVGAWLSGFIEKNAARCFVETELGVALIGGFSAPILFLSFAYLSWFSVMLYGTVFLIGTLVGLELPLLMRILKSKLEFKDLVSRVLTFDYIGALFGSLLFPLLLMPRLGLVRTSLLFGFMNAIVGLWGTWLLKDELRGNIPLLRARGVLVMVLIAAAFIKADMFTTLAEDALYNEPVVYSKTTTYQRIVMTRGSSGFNLFLNGNLQFSSLDEYRYHEALAHPPMLVVDKPRTALILGGGDGLGLRELLRYPDIESVTLVDLDPSMTGLSNEYPPLAELNEHSYEDPRVTVVNQDAMIWLEGIEDKFDIVLIDFPDPNSFSLGKLYTRRFYKLLYRHVADDGAVAVQCTSPLYARKSYWCIISTMEAAGFVVRPYHVTVPSFGVWGFALARKQAFDPPENFNGAPEQVKYLNDEALAHMFHFPLDLQRVESGVNRLDNQILVRYYDDEWDKWQ